MRAGRWRSVYYIEGNNNQRAQTEIVTNAISKIVHAGVAQVGCVSRVLLKLISQRTVVWVADDGIERNRIVVGVRVSSHKVAQSPEQRESMDRIDVLSANGRLVPYIKRNC